MIECPRESLLDSMSESVKSLMRASSLRIRAMGVFEQVKYFSVYDPDVKPGTSTGSESCVLYNLLVRESNEAVSLVSKAYGQLYTSMGGLYNATDNMVVRSKDDHVGTISNDGLFDVTDNNLDTQLKWKFRLTQNQLGTKVRMHILTAGVERTGRAPYASIGVPKKSSTLFVSDIDPLLSPMKRINIIFGALKLYYCIYHLNEHPVTIGIPCLLPKAPPGHRALRALRFLPELRLKPVCRDIHHNGFVNILDARTNILEMVAEIGRGDKIAIKDHWGEEVLTTVVRNDLLEVYHGDGTELGHEEWVNRCRCFVYAGAGEAVMRECVTKVRPNLDWTYTQAEYFLTDSSAQKVATIYPEEHTKTVRIDFHNAPGLECKLLLLAKAVMSASKIYKIVMHEYTPVIEQFLFRETE